jgi:hypothetical protein
MITLRVLVPLLCVGFAVGAFAEEDSPIKDPSISADASPVAVAAAKARGAARAQRDIMAKTFRILYFGIPWSVGKPLVDEATGYRVQIVGDCVAGTAFAAEVNAYNQAMREWHSKQK